MMINMFFYKMFKFKFIYFMMDYFTFMTKFEIKFLFYIIGHESSDYS